MLSCKISCILLRPGEQTQGSDAQVRSAGKLTTRHTCHVCACLICCAGKQTLTAAGTAVHAKGHTSRATLRLVTAEYANKQDQDTAQGTLQ